MEQRIQNEEESLPGQNCSNPEDLLIPEDDNKFQEISNKTDDVIMDWAKESIVLTPVDMKQIEELCETIIKTPENSTQLASEFHQLLIVHINGIIRCWCYFEVKKV